MKGPSRAIWLCSQPSCRVAQGPRTQPHGQCRTRVLGARAAELSESLWWY